MAMFAEARRFLSSVCRYCNTNSGLQRVHHSRRSRSLNDEVVCRAIMPYSTMECTSTEQQSDVVEVTLVEQNLCKQHANHLMSQLEDTTMATEKSIGIMNLTKLLEILPTSSKELAQTIDHIYEVQKVLDRCPDRYHTATSAPQQNNAPGELRISEDGSRSSTNKHLLDGKYLDKLYEIDESNLCGKLNLNSKTESINKFNPLDFLPKNDTQGTASILDKLILGRVKLHNNYKLNKLHDEDQCTNLVSERLSTWSSTGKTFSGHVSNFSKPSGFISGANVLFCDSGSPSRGGTPSGGDNENQHLPTQAELEIVHRHLETFLPYIFSKKHDYRLYTKDLIFENNFVKKPYISQGLTPYVVFAAKLRMWAHFKYANVRLNLMKITSHDHDGTVRVRWRVTGIPQVRAFMFWKFLPWTYKSAMKEESEWLDGFSTFYVQPKTGLIYKHRMDKVIPDEETVVKNPKEKLVDKLRSGLNVGTV